MTLIRRTILTLVVAASCCTLYQATAAAQQPAGINEHAYGRRWGQVYSARDYDRFYHYPYVYYPHNFYGNEYFRSADDLYHRYPAEMRTPIYNRQWFNEFPNPRKYYRGHHFILDQF